MSSLTSLALAGGFFTVSTTWEACMYIYIRIHTHTHTHVRALELWSTGSIVVAHGLSGSTACELFPGQGSNQCPLNRQVDSYPLGP